MTQISGKIFQMTNAAGTENRFPRTVMEAVLGLNSYLQNQFSSLADIYMPIEGITESKPLQEFVYRLCPSSIKAKSVSLDRIYGKTLVWNQLVQNGDFSNGKNGWDNDEGTLSVVDGVANFVFIGTSKAFYRYGDNSPEPVVGHKYILCYSLKGSKQISCGYNFGGNIDTNKWSVGTQWGVYYALVTANSTSKILTVYCSSDTEATLYSDYIEVFDLTLMFGDGHEPTTVAEFEAMFPGYHSYEPGKLISNDAESIETVGFNQWDEEWGVGTLNGTTGQPADSSSAIRSKNLIPVFGGTEYYFACLGNKDVLACAYDAGGIYIGNVLDYSASNQSFTTPNNCAFIRFAMYSGYGTTYNNDICINLSDPAKNGTYEPYRKSTMQLNLGSFQVRDGQGNVTTIIGGLKSAGSVKDEIVGNKYIKRIGDVDLGTLNWNTDWWDSDGRLYGDLSTKAYGATKIIYPLGVTAPSDNNLVNAVGICGSDYNSYVYIGDAKQHASASDFIASLNGVIAYYELATPIEYTLVSPLVPTVKAGTTEERISPNADGLSAPMVADMTYDAQANNDSASAQYALTAGRLLNSHKLWGRDFDGTQDVAGAMTGVTNINSLLYIYNNNFGIGKATPTYKLDVSGNFRVENVEGGVAIGVDGNCIEGLESGSLSDLYIQMNSPGNLILCEGGGRVGIGASPASGYKLDVGGVIHSSTGVVSEGFGTFGSSASSSDARLKKDISAITYEKAITILRQLSGKEWTWNEDMPVLSGKHGSGLIAQEVLCAMPWAVHDIDGKYSLNYNAFWGVAIPVMQSHEQRIRAIEDKLKNE